jgi:hypothetical protein
MEERFSLGLISYCYKFVILYHKLSTQKIMYVKPQYCTLLDRYTRGKLVGSFEASYKDFNLHILSAELDGVRCIHYLTVVCTYKRDQQRGGGDIELNALWNKSWACAQALSHKCRCQCGGEAEAKQRYSVRESGCGKHVSKTRKNQQSEIQSIFVWLWI